MSILLTILAVIIIFSALVLIHEWGHFIAARRAGIKVLEFGIGFPPRLFKKKVGETVYSVNAIPFGGFVKLFGEDSSDPEVLKSKRSFAHQSAWIRTKVIVAGVFMNFVLAIALLTLGFSFGIEPLLVTEEDLFAHIKAGNVATLPGAFVSKVDDKALGLSKGDQILEINDKPIMLPEQIEIFKKEKAEKDVDITVRTPKGEHKKLHLAATEEKYFGIELKPYTNFPRLAIAAVKAGSKSAAAGLASGDVILHINNEEAYFPADLENALVDAGEKVKFQILRNQEVKEIEVALPRPNRVIFADVYEGSAAEKAGFQKGDIVLSMDGVAITQTNQIPEMLKKNPGKEVLYRFERDGKPREIKAKTGDKNFLGVALSKIASFHNNEISVYRDNILTSITEIKKVRYYPWKAFNQAFSESIRLTGLTVAAFGRTIGSIFTKFAVPSDIGGPVQIAYYTHAFIQEGFFALLRFTALLSLSLAVINVLPIPALDGGRLLFIVIEVISGKRVNARFEALVHAIGFALLLLLIILVTYSDITKLL